MESIDHLFEEAGLRPSPVRMLVARAISSAGRPVSSGELESELHTVDRSSITRTLSLFAKIGIVHSIDDGSGSVKYELCHSHSDSEADNDLHPHFHCLRCGATFCLCDSAIPPVVLPEGFQAVTANYVVKGLCPSCARSE